MIESESDVRKNKIVKTHITKRYLTLKLNRVPSSYTLTTNKLTCPIAF
jgi:hypothetical protein